MADVEAKETKVVSTPEKKALNGDAEVEKPAKVVEEIDEDSKTSETDAVAETKENGSSEEKEADEVEEQNGHSTDAPVDTCCIKRKSVGADVTDEVSADGASPEKKAKLEEKPAEAEAEAESNGSKVEAEATA